MGPPSPTWKPHFTSAPQASAQGETEQQAVFHKDSKLRTPRTAVELLCREHDLREGAPLGFHLIVL